MDSEMGAFDCVVTRAPNGDTLAKACLTLYHPDDAMTLLTAQASRMNE